MLALRLSAPWLLPMDGPPIRDGALLVGEDGRIAAVGPEAAVAIPERATREHFTDGVLIPGLVNTHTHLELTGLAGAVVEDDFADWIRHLRRVKQERGPDHFLEAARAGVRRCFEAGITTVADTGDSGAVIRALAEAGGSGIAYQEVFGPHPDIAAESMAGLRRRVEELRAHETARVRLGVSPHAPYTVSGPLYRMVAEYARAEGLPVAVHLAESLAESAFLRGDGPFVEGWLRRGIPLPADLAHGWRDGGPMPATPVEWLDRFGVLGPDTLCIHLVQVSGPDIARLAARGVGVAHCPRSNRRHGHGDAPLGALLGAGLRVGVGTDSEVSLGPTDLLADARAARGLADCSAGAALALVTTDAARAIGLSDEIGSLAPGKWGDVVAVRTGRADTAEAIEEAVLAGRPVGATWVAGREVFRGDPGAQLP